MHIRSLLNALSVFAILASSAAFAADSVSTVDANNSGKNVRDRDNQTMTADRQAEGSKSDVEITREIRRAITKDDSFSTSAKNVKIITKNGKVVLRGPVANLVEGEKIASLAKNCAGVHEVQNKLESKQ